VIRRERDGAPLYEMWFAGSSTKPGADCREFYILRAETSDPDGIGGWKISPEEPVLRRSPGTWDGVAVAAGSVLFDATAPEGEKYRMWYLGYNPTARVGLAWSEDGINWQKYTGNPVLRPESPEQDAQVSAVLRRGNVLEMWYSSWDGAHYHIHYATSVNGVQWTEGPENPVLSPAPGTWDAFSVVHPAVIIHGQPQILREEPLVYKMWYTGWSSENSDPYIGYAEAPAVPIFLRGDCNDDGLVDISDGVCILSWLFQGGAEPPCIAVTNTNGDDEADISDAVYVLAHLFLGGPQPVAPFPECGLGLLQADRELGCGASSCSSPPPPPGPEWRPPLGRDWLPLGRDYVP
jgi:hypothetical protein